MPSLLPSSFFANGRSRRVRRGTDWPWRGDILLTFLALFTATAHAQTPLGDLVKPPADAQHLVFSSTGGKHGDSWIWHTPDGTWMGRESTNLRGQVFETDSATKLGADSLPTSVTVRGFTPNGDAGETFTIADIWIPVYRYHVGPSVEVLLLFGRKLSLIGLRPPIEITHVPENEGRLRFRIRGVAHACRSDAAANSKGHKN